MKTLPRAPGRLRPWLVLALLGSLGACRAPASTEPSTPDPTPEAELQAAVDLMQAGRAEEGLVRARGAVDLAHADPGPGSPTAVRAELGLASMLLATGQVDEAREWAASGQEASEALLDEARVRVAMSLKFRGSLQLMGRDFQGAETTYRRAVALVEAARGPDDPETARHLGNLASALQGAGRTGEARAVFERALGIWEESGEEDPVYTVQTLTGLGNLALQDGDPDLAVELHLRGLRIQQQVFGPEAPQLRNHLRRTTALLRRLGREEEARALEGQGEDAGRN